MSSIYVSKLDECTTESTLSDHFSKYGFINNIQLSKLPNGSCKGYAKITTKDVTAYRMILSSEHIINNVKVKVEPFIEGEAQIVAKDREMVKRRVCVFGVPKNFNDFKFRKVFEKHLGDVENAYVRSNKEKKFNYGFVTFNTEEGANRALDLKIIPLRENELDEESQIFATLQIKEFKSKGLIRRQKKLENTKKRVYFNNNYLKVYGENLISDMYKPDRGSQEQQGQIVFERNNEVYYQKNKMNTPINEGTGTQGDKKLFFEPERLKIYIKKILEMNPQIKKLEQNQVVMLELFFFNKRFRHYKRRTIYNYDCLATRFSKRVNENHTYGNLSFNRSSKNSNLNNFNDFDGGYYGGNTGFYNYWTGAYTGNFMDHNEFYANSFSSQKFY